MILFRYLWREVMQSMVAVSFVLILMLLSTRFIRDLTRASNGEISNTILFKILFFLIPDYIQLVLPMGLFLSLLLAYGRLYVDSEMVVMSAYGLSRLRLAVYTLLIASCVALPVALTSFYLSPKGALEFHKLWDDPANFGGLMTLQAGRFESFGDSVLYVEAVNREKTDMQKVFFAKYIKNDDQKLVAIDGSEVSSQKLMFIVADKARVFNKITYRTDDLMRPDITQRYLELYDGKQYTGVPGALDFQIIDFAQYGKLIGNVQEISTNNVIDAKSTRELLGMDTVQADATLQWRAATPIVVFIVALIACALSKTNPRGGRYIKLLPAIFIYVIYLLVLSMAKGGLLSGKLPIVYGLWWVHGIFLTLGIVLLYADNWWYKLRMYTRRGSGVR